MKYNPTIHHRRSIRLKGYDYSQNGAYFITICVQNRESLFGEIIDGDMKLNDPGKMIDIQWNELKNRFKNIELDEYVIMPNHFHGIISIVNDEIFVGAHVGAPLVGALDGNDGGNSNAGAGGAGIKPARTDRKNQNATIGDIIGAFKSIATHEYINGVKNNNWQSFDGKLWQRNYYEIIIRNENSLEKIRKYIRNNPRNWKSDKLFLNK